MCKHSKHSWNSDPNEIYFFWQRDLGESSGASHRGPQGRIMSRVTTDSPTVDQGEPAWAVAELFPAQGQWTEGDYLDITDSTNRLVELVDGRLEVLPMPTVRHQLIAMFLCDALRDFVKPRNLGVVVIAALRVRLREKDIREPDIVFKTREHLDPDADRYWEKADLVMEVVSPDPGSHKRDWVTKREEYARAGIGEYWIVDPQQQRVLVLRLEGEHYVPHSEAAQTGEVRSALLPGFTVNAAQIWAAAKPRASLSPIEQAMRPRSLAFTLIELLVVVTIIVALLTLLTPAMDQALYQAELAVDAAQVRGIAQSTLGYATANKRQYPGPYSTWDAMQLRNGANWNVPGQLGEFVAPKMFVDPFLKIAKLDVSACMQDPKGVYMPGYHWYTSWGTSANAIVPMNRLGQRMVFTDPGGEVRPFNVIIADRDTRWVPGMLATTSHPDKNGFEHLWAYQQGGNPWAGGQLTAPVIGPTLGNVYVAWYENLMGAGRGPVDNHYGLDDGSALRLKDVPIVQTPDDDTRITFVPDVGNLDEYKTGRRTQLPKFAQ